MAVLFSASLIFGCTVTPNPVVPDAENITGPIQQANAVGGQVALDQAMRAAMSWYAENGSFAGFGPEQAANYDPSTSYNTSTTAVEGQVSIRVASPTAVVLVTRDGSGGVACKAYDGVTGATTSGSTDAASIEECV